MKRDWKLLWGASAISALGDGAFLAALPLLAVTMTTDPRLVAGVTAWGTLPWLLMSLPAGALADRLDPRHSIAVVKTVQAALLVTLAAITLAGAGRIGVLYVVAFALGAAETLVRVSWQKLMPAVVEHSQLEKANGRLNASFFTIREFLAPPLGALMFSFAASLPLWLDAVTFALAAFLAIKIRTQTVTVAKGRGGVGEGIRWLARHRLLRTVTMLSGAANLANYMTVSTLVLFAQQRLGLGAVGYGVLIATMAIGGISGSLVSARIVARFGGRRVATITIFTTPAAMLAIAFVAHDLITMAALAFVTSGGAALWNVAVMSQRQRLVPPELMGRVSSAGLMVTFGTQPVGALAGGLIAASPLGITGPWIVAGVIRLTAAALSLKALRSDQSW